MRSQFSAGSRHDGHSVHQSTSVPPLLIALVGTPRWPSHLVGESRSSAVGPGVFEGTR